MDRRIAYIEGTRLVRKAHFYRNTETKEEYLHICGGLALPGGGHPGFAVIVAVVKNDEEEPPFKVLEEIEEVDIESLLQKCINLRERYGFQKCPELLRVWHGNSKHLADFVTDFNKKLWKKDKEAEWIILSPPLYESEEPHALKIYLTRIRSCKKRLSLGSCNKLLNHIHNVPPEVALKKSPEDYLAVACLGGVIHSLMPREPWLKPVHPEETLPTMKDDYNDYAEQVHEEALRGLGVGGVDFGELDEYDTGELVDTVD